MLFPFKKKSILISRNFLRTVFQANLNVIAQSKPCFMRSGKHYPSIKPDIADLFDGLFSTRGALPAGRQDAPGYYISHPWC